MGYQTVLVGTDGSDSSFKAVDRAADIASDSGATLVLVCAYHPLSARQERQAADELGDLKYKVAGSHPAEDILQDTADRVRKAGVKKVETVAEEGEPVDVLLEAATSSSADLLVIGNRGLNSIAGRVLGSVPANVSHKARCDVLIVHTTDRGK